MTLIEFYQRVTTINEASSRHLTRSCTSSIDRNKNMASYTILWTNETWDKYSNTKRVSGFCPIDYVAGDNKKPLSTVQPGDEIFIVTVKHGNLYVGGRLVVETLPLSKRDAAILLGRSDLIDKELFFIAKREEIDDFRSSCLIELDTAKNLELIKVDGSICRPTLDKKGLIDRQAFRSPFKLSLKSVEMLRSVLRKSIDPVHTVVASETDSVGRLTSVDRLEERAELSIDESCIFLENNPDTEISGVHPEIDLNEIANKIDEECANLEGYDVDVVVKRRVGQGIFRNLLLEKFNSMCCITGIRNKRLLIASHIVPWSESTKTQKLAPDNGLLLSVTMDALFDKGLISFSSSGRILIGNDLDCHTIKTLGLENDITLPEELLTVTRKENLRKHRENHGFKD